MNCPYCKKEMADGALVTLKVPKWVKKGEEKGFLLKTQKRMASCETAAYYCEACRKLIIDV